MKKLLLTFATATLVIYNTSAQITLDQSSFNSAQVMGLDSLMTTSVASPYPNLHPSTNATWDMSNLIYISGVDSQYRVASAGASQYADSIIYDFAGFRYASNIQSSITSAGIIHYGEEMKRQAYHLDMPPITQANDSLILDAQSIVYSSPEVELQFPATYNAHWGSDYQYDFHFHLTLAAMSFNNAPGYVRSIVSRRDTVVGWGQMRVKDAMGNVSNYYNVLQVQSTETVTDSFFLNGAPASGVLLTAFGAAQGQVSVSNTQYYYRPQEITPLATVYYDNGFASTPTEAQTHVQRLQTGVANVPYESSIHIYPNPVINHTVNIDVPTTGNGNWSYELINMSGQTVVANSLNMGSKTHTQIVLNDNLAPGIYYLRLKNEDGSVLVRPLDVTK